MRAVTEPLPAALPDYEHASEDAESSGWRRWLPFSWVGPSGLHLYELELASVQSGTSCACAIRPVLEPPAAIISIGWTQRTLPPVRAPARLDVSTR
jgi:hypothetical protein